MEPGSKVRTGLDVLCAQQFAYLVGLRVGLVTHPAAVDGRLRSALDVFSESGRIALAAVFGPEHGLLGQAQDLIAAIGGAGGLQHQLPAAGRPVGFGVLAARGELEQVRKMGLAGVVRGSLGRRGGHGGSDEDEEQRGGRFHGVFMLS